MHQLRNTDIDSENSSPDKVDCETITPNKSLEVFKDLHMVLSYAKYKRIPMCSDSDQSVDNELSLSELKTIDTFLYLISECNVNQMFGNTFRIGLF